MSLVAAAVDALDDAHDAVHVRGAVRDDQHVGARVGREMRRLRHHRPQDRHQLPGGDIPDLHHLGHDLVGGRADAVRQVVCRHLPGVEVRQHLDHVAGWHGDVVVDLQDREEGLVEGVRAHRRRRQHRHLGAHARIDDEALAGHLAHGLDDLVDVRVLVVGRDLRTLLRRGGERQRAGEEGGHPDESGHEVIPLGAGPHSVPSLHRRPAPPLPVVFFFHGILDGRRLLHFLDGRDRIDRDLLLLAAALDGQRHGRALADAAQDFEAAIRVVERGPVHRHHQVAGLQAQSRELRAVAAGIHAIAAQRAAGEIPAAGAAGHRRPADSAPAAVARCRRARRSERSALGLARHARRAVCAAAAGETRQDAAIRARHCGRGSRGRIDGKELRAAGKRRAGRVDARGLPGRADDRPAVLGLAAGQRAGEREVRRSCRRVMEGSPMSRAFPNRCALTIAGRSTTGAAAAMSGSSTTPASSSADRARATTSEASWAAITIARMTVTIDGAAAARPRDAARRAAQGRDDSVD